MSIHHKILLNVKKHEPGHNAIPTYPFNQK
jgi:hypothetical protein